MVLPFYPDSSFLVSLFCLDANSPAAVAYMSRRGGQLAFTPLHRIEARNAIRNAAARGALSEQDRRDAFRRIENDLDARFLVPTPLAWTDVLRRADELSERHREKNGQRTLDLLHVASAMEIGSTVFLSFDKRQSRLAKVVGLTVKP
jgi:predicted nucleic acid-binding protein